MEMSKLPTDFVNRVCFEIYFQLSGWWPKKIFFKLFKAFPSVVLRHLVYTKFSAVRASNFKGDFNVSSMIIAN